MDRTPESFPPARRRLYLDKDNGWLLGVCAGLANYLRVDCAVVRVAVFIATLFMPKMMIAAYLVAWLILDERNFLRGNSS